MIDLTCATLVSPIYNDSREHLDLTIRMMRYMRSIVQFGHAILITACKVESPVPAEVIQVPPTDIGGLQTFQMTVLPRLIHTPFMMMCHNDGFVILPELWTNEFLSYDFIGAPWGDRVVGNDGFSLQSQKLLWSKSKLPWIDTVQGDEYVCRVHKEQMIRAGVTFAPFGLATLFSTETVNEGYPSFGFHGKTHSDVKYKKGWELIEAFEKA